jgi:glucose-6-phosphate isomerase
MCGSYDKTRTVHLTLFNDKPSSAAVAEEFENQRILEKLKAIDSKAHRKGLDALDPEKNVLVRIGTEVDGSGKVIKNSYGVFNLSWKAESRPDWAKVVEKELDEIRTGIRRQHKVPLRFLIWAGMGGSAEDKSMYNSVGLLRRGPRCYVLDSTDPAKLKQILEDIAKRSQGSIENALQSTLVVGMAMGMTSFEPVVNLEKLAALYAKYKVESRPHFIYMTLPKSLLDRFGREQGYRKIELQLDSGNSTAGRHSSPLTRGSLYPLGLAGVPLDQWIEATFLSKEDIYTAWRLSAFLNTQATAGRDKVTLLAPAEWSGIGMWTKQDFEESLGKSEEFGLKIIIGEKIKLANYRSPREPSQDRSFLAVHLKGADTDNDKVAALRRAGYPVAVLTLQTPSLSRYMQFVHYAVFGIGYLQRMNFVTQPGVELYKSITSRIYTEAQRAGSIDNSQTWTAMQMSRRKAKWQNTVTLYYNHLPEDFSVQGQDAAEAYSSIVKQLATGKQIEYGELTFFGDMRYTTSGKTMRRVLDRAGERIFRTALRMPVDICEGPAMNHSYHEMIIGHGRCLSTVLLSEKAEKLPAADYTADYHRAQFLATQMALAERGRYVLAITIKDMERATLSTLDGFFRAAAQALRAMRTR